MRNSNVIAVLLLCSLSGICVSSESQTVDVSPGEEVTLLCSNFSSAVTQIMWFRVVKRSKPRSTYLDVQANVEEQNPQPTEVQGSDDLIYAAVTFRLAEGNQRPAAQTEVESNAIYSATT
ncbi:hypothetical protein NQZ68_017927 [Dissostichus eleginoides]|nr:hypothetical protein NQZ68_017927 [Dissostichus eleginoides]